VSSLNTLILETARRGDLHHAIILHGPAHDEMRELAFGIAKAGNCRNGSTGDDCPSCHKIDRGVHPDVHTIEIEENRKLISIEQIRSVIVEASLKPFEGRTKVFIVDPADAMSISGANALLKTLEEPVPCTLFVLLTRSADMLLPTIRSRSQAISVRPPAPEPAERLAEREGISLHEARLRTSARSETGADDAVAFGRDAIALLRRASNGEIAALLRLAQTAGQSEDPPKTMGMLAGILRDVASMDPRDTLAPEDVEAIRARFRPRLLLDAATAVLLASTRLVVNADARLLVEGALLTLARRDAYGR